MIVEFCEKGENRAKHALVEISLNSLIWPLYTLGGHMTTIKKGFSYFVLFGFVPILIHVRSKPKTLEVKTTYTR